MSGPEQTAGLSARLEQVEADLSLALRAINVLLHGEGYHGRWSVEDFTRLREALDRRDPGE